MAAWTRWAATFVAVLASVLLYPIVVKIRRRSQKPRPDGIQVLSDPPDAKFQIVAVHGLGAHPDHTWTANSADRVHAGCPEKVHLLRDLLGQAFPDARVLSFAHNSDWLIDAPVKTAQQIGDRLLGQLKANQPAQRLPTIFIGHSFGGIIIKEALCKPDSQEIIKDTCGVIFLGTPHQGSPVSGAGAAAAFLTGFLGSDTTLLLSLRNHHSELTNLERRFRFCINPKEGQRQKARIISFYETKPTYLFGWFSIGLVVPGESAMGYADETIDIDADHSGLNKCRGREAELYKRLEEAILDLRAPSPLEQADAWVRDKHYTPDKLKIERLSGYSLPMDQCYINLAIVEQPSGNTGRSGGDAAHPSSPFPLLARQKVETPNKKIQIELPTIFHPRKGPNGDTTDPRRILIRGRAGVGKTTLCKKIVYEFARGAWREWSELFDRVLWVPLRNLKLKERRQAAAYNCEDLFYHEYFSGQGRDDGGRLAKELRQTLETKSSKTLFLLDGLDEVSQDWSGETGMSRFLKELLNQPNVIITSRPHASLPPISLDLEVETIGFHPDQVEDYIQMAFTNRETDVVDQERVGEVQSFLQKHWLVRSLVRIPIQLDALCFTWEGKEAGSNSRMKLDTMTTLYQAIEHSLWKKDIKFPRLLKETETHAHNALPREIEDIVKPETTLLECLAFTGLSSDIIDFTPEHRNNMFELFSKSKLKLKLKSLDDTLANLSFLRTSDPSGNQHNRSYHFLHLTFQEYFAARYFVRQWTSGQELECLELKTWRGGPANCPQKRYTTVEYLRKHKYNARYDIFWRFVAGLLDASSDKEQLCRFFRTIEDEPRDLLGPTHQRLVMHCLSEVSTKMPLREALEKKLAQWLLFECGFTNDARLASEMEFPEQALHAALEQESEAVKMIILRSLARRPRIPPKILELGTWLRGNVSGNLKQAVCNMLWTSRESLLKDALEIVATWLEDQDTGVRRAAARALGQRSDLPEEILKAVAARLEHQHRDVRSAAARALGQRSDLPEEILKAVAARLEDQDVDVSDLAEVILRRHRDFYSALLNSPSVKLLYEVFLRRSYTEQWSWYVEGGKCYQVGSEEFEWEVGGEFKNTVSRARPASMPSMNGGVA